MAPNPWSKFAVGAPSARSNWTEPTCTPLVEVAHVAHVPIAIRIAEDGKLRADLVFDQSKLNTDRIRVVWLSPNHWSDGFRYGNVRFSFDWMALQANKRAYWVESIAYSVPACRILITDQNYGLTLPPYDPTIGDGPWWVDPQGNHYWNGNHCLEIMVEGDLPLANVATVDFVSHHKRGCNIDHTSCRYRGCERENGGAEFLGLLASREPLLAGKLPGLIEQTNKGARASFAVHGAIGVLSRRLRKLACSRHGTIVATDTEAPALARALLRSLADDRLSNDRAAIASLFSGLGEAETAVLSALASALGLPDTTALDPF